MKKLTAILTATILTLLASSCSMMYAPLCAAGASTSAAEAVSRDPYEGRGRRGDYLALARRYESECLRWQAAAAGSAESMVRSARYGMNASSVSSLLYGGSSMIDRGLYIRQCRMRARQARAEQQRYLRLAAAAKR